MADFELSVEEKKTVLQRKEHLHAVIAGHHIEIDVQSEDDACGEMIGAGAQINITPVDYGRLRLGILSCSPRFVSDLEAFADQAPVIFRAIAQALRDLGKEDLRSEAERKMDVLEAGHVEAMRANRCCQ